MSTIESLISLHRATIIDQWSERARRLASARGLARPELLNIIPRYVDSLASGVLPLGAPSRKRQALIERHAAARMRQGFDVAEVVEELHALAETIRAVVLNPSAADHPSAAGVASLFEEVQLRIAEVVGAFREHLLEDEQFEKRYQRLIMQVATDALQPGSSPLTQRLGDVLNLVMEAMGAQSAALLLYDERAGALVTKALAGCAQEALAGFVGDRPPSAFARAIVASSDEPTSAPDAEVKDSLPVSDALRREGINAVLGVRLPPAQSLVGVMCVGIREDRPFSSRERQRIELLGERLLLHLENARLFADRNEKLQALERERELRERFVSVLAHDLRGPLSVAKLGAGALSKTSAQGAAPVAARVLRSLDRLERMVRDLLDANRLRAGQPLPFAATEANLADIARSVVADLTESFGPRFETQVQPSVVGRFDVDLLARAVWNLAVNAVKYGAPDSPILIRVETEGASALLSVHNDGNPISPADQQRLFEPFQRTSRAEQSQKTGWGLGLTLVRGAAVAHAGEVTVSSSAETGTTFTIRLPLTHPAALTRTEASALAAPH